MKQLNLFIALLFFSFICNFSNTSKVSNIYSSIGFQVHSWNDLRSWKQGILKGIQWMKIDPFWNPQSFCLTQERANHSDPRGCMVLNHDDPISSRTNYNTTDDVLDFISNPSNRAFFTSDKKIYIALCFKNSRVTSNDNKLWISLVDDLFNRANSIIKNLNLNLEFILDGAATSSQYKDLWRPWNWTFISSGDPIEAMFSNDPNLGYDRFQILNEMVFPFFPTYYIEYVAFYNYGKFAKQNKYSYLNWEPCDQQPIQEIIQVYLEKNLEQTAGFRFAINIDPIEFQVYTGSLSRTALNQALVNAKGQSTPFLIPFSYSNDVGIILFSSNSKWSYQTYFSLTFPFGEWIINSEGNVDSSLLSIQSVSYNSNFISETNNLILVSDANSQFVFYQLNYTTFQLDVVSSGRIQSNIDMSFGSSFIQTPSGLLLAHVYSTTSINCSFAWQILQFNNSTHTFTPISNPVCFDYLTSSASVILIDSSSPSFTYCSPNEISSLVLGSSEYHIFGIALCFNVNSKEIKMKGNLQNLGVGTNPKLSKVNLNGSYYIGETHGNGFCWNCELRNKRPDIGLCDNVPESTDFILNYSFGSLSDWFLHFQNSLPTPWFSNCHETIQHGMYDMGSYPSGVLLPYQGKVLSLATHRGIDSSVINSHDCGLANAYEGLLLDGWYFQI